MTQFAFADNHPLMEKPLKGKWLREFIARMEDNKAVTAKIEAHMPPEMRDGGQVMGEAMQITQRELLDKLSGPQAESFGIDARDLRHMMKKKLGLEGDADVESLFDAAHNQDMRVAAWQSMELQLMTDFSACLAHQHKDEGGLKEYGVMIKQGLSDFAAYQKRRTDMLKVDHPELFSDEDNRRQLALQIAFSTVFQLEGIRQLENRDSPLASTFREVFSGKKFGPSIMQGVLGQIAAFHDLDLDNKRDQETVSRILKEAMARVYTKLKITPPPEVSR